MSKINLAVGTREHSTQAPVAYEMPQEVVREAIVNAVAHRDYTSNGSVQVMLFADRLEVWNPGTLPPSLSLEKLRHPHGSVPGNPLLAEPLYLTKYIERMGTGTGDMIKRCRHAGLPEPEFALTDGFVITLRRNPERAFEAVGGEVTWDKSPDKSPDKSQEKSQEKSPDKSIHGSSGHYRLPGTALEKQRIQAMRVSGIEKLFSEHLYVHSGNGLEMTIPEKPNSRLQKYRLTPEGKALLARLSKKES